jgi:pimeloyl-ACP methyl ester carboxylesterase/multidrug resistance efflux pump
MAIFILVHGSWHGGWCWDSVALLLRGSGHVVHAPDLAGLGRDRTDLATVTLATWRDQIVALVDSAREPVVLVGHSRGGIVISEVAEARPEKIACLVYLAAFLLRDGQSIARIMRADGSSLILPSLIVFEDGISSIVRREALAEIFYSDCTPEEVAGAAARLRPEPVLPNRTPVRVTEARFGRVRRAYIATARDRAVPPALQRRMYTALPCDPVITMETAHSPFLSAPPRSPCISRCWPSTELARSGPSPCGKLAAIARGGGTMKRPETRRGTRYLTWLGLAALLGYIAWIGAPYLRSVIVRDAALTSWVNIAAAAISGNLDGSPLVPGERVGADGRIAKIEDPRADSTALAKARADLARTEGRVAGLGALAGRLAVIVGERRATADAFAATFKQDLEATIAGADSSRELTRKRLELERLQAGRSAVLVQRGAGSQAAADAANALVAEHQRALSESETITERAVLRRRAADAGVFLLDDGTDAGIAYRSLDDARLRLEQVETELAAAKIDLAATQALAAAALNLYERNRSAIVSAPPEALVWSLMAAPGSAIQPGMPVASWVDCHVLLVDVPLSDVEVALLRKGAAADIVIEGATERRHGTVALLRGAAATIGSVDLAAIAKGRRPGIGQALVALEPTEADLETCPIGHAAYVDFPGIGIVDILRARLRL